MRKIREVLRLRHEIGLSMREIAVSCQMGKTTVLECLARAEAAGIGWPLPEGLDDEELERRLYSGEPALKPAAAMPDMVWIHRELRRKGVTLELLWREYRHAHPDGYQYSRFCDLYREWKRQQDPVMRQVHKAGEKVFVDWAGMTMVVVDPRTGEAHKVYVFVATLGASSYTFADVFLSMDQHAWILAHVRAFAFFDGVPEVVVPDNTNTAVKSPNVYEPELNPTYRELAEYYGVAVLPARVRKPRDKAKVESAVQAVEREVLAPLRNRRFFSLEELRDAVCDGIDALNARPFQKLKGSRYSLYEEIDRPALRPLPARPYEYAEWKRRRVHSDYHVDVFGALYSVPFQLAHKEVDVRITATSIEVMYKNRRVAAHPRCLRKGEYRTEERHMPAAHRRYRQAPFGILRAAEEVGPKTKELVQIILRTRPHPEQGYRACLGILRLVSRYGQERLEAASAKALALGAHTYRSVESILRTGQETVPKEPEAVPASAVPHGTIRGPQYYAPEGTS